MARPLGFTAIPPHRAEANILEGSEPTPMLPPALLFLLPGAPGPQASEIGRLQAPGWAHDGQGTALASDGKSLLVGAPFGRSYALDGSAVLYEHDPREPLGWREVQRLEAPGYGVVDRFGDALDVDGDVLAIGAWREEQTRGAVYVYERRAPALGFEPVARLTPSFPWPGQRFGLALDLDGDRLLVGAPRGAPPPGLQWEGRAYLFEREPSSGAWLVAAELEHPLRASTEPQFGQRVALEDDLAVVATFYSGFGFAFQVHVFAREAGVWRHRQVLSERDVGGAGLESWFGVALALQGRELYVMDPERRAVHLFRRAGGGEFAWETSIPAQPGMVLTVRGDRMAIGRRFFHAPVAVQLFERVTGAWLPGALLSPEAPASTIFGSAVVLDHEHVLVGDPTLPGPTQPAVGGVRVFGRQARLPADPPP